VAVEALASVGEGNMASPLRADHRMLKSLLSLSGKGSFDPRPEELDKMSSVFKRAGGSWKGVFQGSSDDVSKLKKVVKVAIQKKLVTPADTKENDT
jgi:hypothetical protein